MRARDLWESFFCAGFDLDELFVTELLMFFMLSLVASLWTRGLGDNLLGLITSKAEGTTTGIAFLSTS